MKTIVVKWKPECSLSAFGDTTYLGITKVEEIMPAESRIVDSVIKRPDIGSLRLWHGDNVIADIDRNDIESWEEKK